MMSIGTKLRRGRVTFTQVSRSIASRPRRRDRCEALDKSSVAELTALMIDDMSCDELFRVICASELPRLLCFDVWWNISLHARETLRRLAYLARQCCQNQVN